MKIVITLEKRDILRLIEADLAERNIVVKAGTALVYKGALEVKLEVETEDEIEARPPVPVEAVRSGPPKPIVIPPREPEMSSILAESRRTEQTSPGKFPQRTLGPNESLEYPKD